MERTGITGEIFLMALVAVTVFFGFTGLALDGGYFFEVQRLMQSAADSAALAGAQELHRNVQSTLMTSAARADAAKNGFTDGANNVAVTVHRPPETGLYKGDSRFVEVIVAQTRPRLFMSIFERGAMTVSARSVAGPADSRNCVYVLKRSGPNALVVSGKPGLTAGCGIVVNSTSTGAVRVTRGSCLTAQSVSLAGTGVGDCYRPIPVAGVPPEADPLGGLLPPKFWDCGHQRTVHIRAGHARLTPGVYCGGIAISGGSTSVVFESGLYVVQGAGLIVGEGASISGAGVTFYLPGGGLNITGRGLTRLSAPANGDWEGILFFQSRVDNRLATIATAPGSSLEGTLYFPSAKLDYSAPHAVARYTAIVAHELQVTGPAVLGDDYSSLSNGSPLKRVALAE